MYAPDTIIAPATAAGAAAVAIVRLSGPRAFEILEKIWRPLHPRKIEARRMALGEVIDPQSGTPLDRALAVTFPGPQSFTGEDVAELHCHGGAYLVRRVIAVAIAHGARFAEPGEFSRRAFMNGRIDLTEAEAIADLVSARSDAALNRAINQLSGALATRIIEIRNRIIAIRAHLEAAIDFADEDIRITPVSEIERDIALTLASVATLHDSFRRGKLAHDGIRAAIIGKPNAGKSSLLNLLLGADRAIVTPIPGTTRDVIEDTVHVGPHALVIADTAGLRDSADEIERLGVERSRNAAEAADLVMAVFDGSRELESDDARVVEMCRGKRAIGILNKSDLPRSLGRERLMEAGFDGPVVEISALRGDGLLSLHALLERLAGDVAGDSTGAEIAISRERHRAALAQAIEALKHARQSAEHSMPPEIVAVDVTAASDALARITGEVTTEEVLDAVFREFCIGK